MSRKRLPNEIKAMFDGGTGLLQIAIGLVMAILKKGGTYEQIHALTRPEGAALLERMAEAVVGVAKTVADSFYTLSLADQIKAGHYNWFNSDITAEHFPRPNRGASLEKLKVFHFNRSVSSDEAIRLMAAEGYEPVNIAELLNYGAKNPDEQRQYPIIALGSLWAPWGGPRYVAYLDEYAGRRGLDLGYFDDDWSDHCRFLAASK